MKLVRLYGQLGKKFGRVHRLDVSSPGEAVKALTANYPAFAQELINSGERGIGYRCIVDGENISAEGLHWPLSQEFSITPVVQGSGKIGKILLGAALLVGAFAFAPAALGMAGGLDMGAGIGFLGITYGGVALFGAALVLGGIAQMLTPTPKAAAGATNTENAYFNGPVNNTNQGGPVPLGYGRAIVGSVVISGAITVEQQDGASTRIGGNRAGIIP